MPTQTLEVEVAGYLTILNDPQAILALMPNPSYPPDKWNQFLEELKAGGRTRLTVKTIPTGHVDWPGAGGGSHPNCLAFAAGGFYCYGASFDDSTATLIVSPGEDWSYRPDRDPPAEYSYVVLLLMLALLPEETYYQSPNPPADVGPRVVRPMYDCGVEAVRNGKDPRDCYPFLVIVR